MAVKKAEERKTGFAKVIEVARFLNVSKHTIYRAVDKGTLGATIVGESIRIDWDDVYALHRKASADQKAKRNRQ